MNKLLITAICLIAALGLGLGFSWPKYQDLKALEANIEEKDLELQSETDYFSQIKETSEKLKGYEDSLAKISSALPPDPSLPALFNFLQQASSQTGLVLEEISLGSISPFQGKQESIKKIYVNLQLAGSYPAFKDFLSTLERSTKLIEVESIFFSSPREPEEPFSFKVNIKTHSY